ncbi:MAG: helix-turn-helix domain-containing protein, partial [Spirochaetota bacterium]
MESIGEKLKTARKEKGYSLDQVSRETHIAKRFVEALEEEDFDAFPGEPYLIGFLKTYSIFLDLDPQEMVNLYKSFKLQEQPAPIDEL